MFDAGPVMEFKRKLRPYLYYGLAECSIYITVVVKTTLPCGSPLEISCAAAAARRIQITKLWKHLGQT